MTLGMGWYRGLYLSLVRGDISLGGALRGSFLTKNGAGDRVSGSWAPCCSTRGGGDSYEERHDQVKTWVKKQPAQSIESSSLG